MAFGEFYLADVAGPSTHFFFGQKIAPLDVGALLTHGPCVSTSSHRSFFEIIEWIFLKKVV